MWQRSQPHGGTNEGITRSLQERRLSARDWSEGQPHAFDKPSTESCREEKKEADRSPVNASDRWSNLKGPADWVNSRVIVEEQPSKQGIFYYSCLGKAVDVLRNSMLWQRCVLLSSKYLCTGSMAYLGSSSEN